MAADCPNPKRHKKLSSAFVTISCNDFDHHKTFKVSCELYGALKGADWKSQVVEVKDPKTIRLCCAMYYKDDEESEELSTEEQSEGALADTAIEVDTVPLDEPHFLLYWDSRE